MNKNELQSVALREFSLTLNELNFVHELKRFAFHYCNYSTMQNFVLQFMPVRAIHENAVFDSCKATLCNSFEKVRLYTRFTVKFLDTSKTRRAWLFRREFTNRK